MNTQNFRTSSAWAGADFCLRIALFLLPVFASWMVPVASGQTNTTVNLSTQARNPDFSAMPVTRPVTVGTTLPSTCLVGQLFFNSSASAGNNLQACTSANTWTGLWTNFTLPLSVANGGTGTSSPGLVAGANVNISGAWPNQTISATSSSAVAVGSSLPATCSVGQIFFNSSAAAGSNLFGCTATNTWTVMGGATLTSPLPVANGGTGTATPGLVAGANVAVTGTWPNQTISSSPAPIGATLPNSCTVGQLFFNSAAAAGTNLNACTPANTWTAVGAITSPLPVINGGTGTATPNLVAGSNVTITGTWPNQTISASGAFAGNANAIQGTSVSTTAPSNNQALVYNGTSSAYVPTTMYTLQNGLGTSTSGGTSLQVNISMGVRAVTTTSDTLAATDCGGLVTYNNASAVTVALPTPALGGNFMAGCPITLHNYGGSTLALNPAGSTIGGASSLTVNSAKGCLVVSDGTNWQLGNCN